MCRIQFFLQKTRGKSAEIHTARTDGMLHVRSPRGVPSGMIFVFFCSDFIPINADMTRRQNLQLESGIDLNTLAWGSE
jgi:hypothetical protein